jgi:formylglycine-generating enzyme required for sulfatase activity
VNLAVVGLIQETLLKKSAHQVHVAEVYLGGLMQRVGEHGTTQFEFKPGVRAELRKSLPKSEARQVLEAVSGYVADRLDLPLRSLDALLMANLPEELAADVLPFAEIAIDTLRQMGGNYAAFAEQVVQSRSGGSLEPEPTHPEESQKPANDQNDQSTEDTDADSPIQAFEFAVVTVEVEDEPDPSPNIALEPFEFEMATLEQRQTGSPRRQLEWVIQRQSRQARQLIEHLTDKVALAMVAIPARKFLMGSPPEEPGRSGCEGPQHYVTVPEFYLGKYPITQAQWRVGASLPPVRQDLDPDPSSFKGDDRPVENVSWDDAVEFCARLSQLTGRDYRLPSEAEWEYACRSGTTKPFHFGATMTPDLANYNWDRTYGELKVTKPKDFRGTTPVGQFGVANAFGLYDMHGNVWEWCADHWHANYAGAPIDGSAWLSEEKSSNSPLRGGSFRNYPEHCRSAFRSSSARVLHNRSVGFRVSCAAARALP